MRKSILLLLAIATSGALSAQQTPAPTPSTFIERGTLRQNTSGGWGLTYQEPKKERFSDTPTQGITFRVPTHLFEVVSAMKGQLVQATISKEHDPKHPDISTYVLTAVTSAQ